MDSVIIRGGDLVISGTIRAGTDLTIADGRIAAVGKAPRRAKGVPEIDATGLFVAPGFIDTHIHGDPQRIFENEVKTGTTSFLVTQSCASVRDLERLMDRIALFYASHPFGSSMIGVRLEGPFISKARAGAQDARFLLMPSIERAAALNTIFGPFLKMITVAPELDRIGPVISFFRRCGVHLSIGHSDATYDETRSAIDRGIAHATHLFNAMRQIDRREPGIIGACLADDVVAVEIIPDLVHIHPANLQLVLKAKRRDRILAVTDSIVSAGRRARAVSGAYRTREGALAGSRLTMIDAVRNLVSTCGATLPEAVRCATENPARFFGLRGKGTIRAGADADLVLFDRNFDVQMTIALGQSAYRKKGF